MDKVNRKVQPEIRLIDQFSFPKPDLINLDNGIPVYMINLGTQDINKIEFIFNAGSWYEDKVLVSKFTNKMLKEGTRSYSSARIHEITDYFGAHLNASMDKDMAYVSLFSLNKHVRQLIPVLEEIIFQPTFPDKELKIRVQNKKQEFLVNMEKLKYIARWKFNEMIFGKTHPYGRFFDTEDFDKLNTHDLIQFHKSNYIIDHCRIIVAGKIPDELLPLLNKHFGSYKTSSQLFNQIHFDIESTINRKIHIRKDHSVQSALRIGKMLVNKTHPDYFKLKVANSILGGYFGSRLMTNIREDKGYTYGIGSVISSLQNAGTFSISSEVGTDVTDDAINEIYHEIKVLQQDKVSEDELNLVKNYMLGIFLRSMDGPFALSDSLKSILEYGLDTTFFINFIETIKNITPEEIRSTMQKYFEIDSLFELTVGK